MTGQCLYHEVQWVREAPQHFAIEWRADVLSFRPVLEHTIRLSLLWGEFETSHQSNTKTNKSVMSCHISSCNSDCGFKIPQVLSVGSNSAGFISFHVILSVKLFTCTKESSPTAGCMYYHQTASTIWWVRGGFQRPLSKLFWRWLKHLRLLPGRRHAIHVSSFTNTR